MLARARPSRTGVRTVWIEPRTDNGTQQASRKGHMQVIGLTKKVCMSVFEKQSSRGLIQCFTVHAPVSWKTSKTQEYTMLSSEDEFQAPHGRRGWRVFGSLRPQSPEQESEPNQFHLFASSSWVYERHFKWMIPLGFWWGNFQGIMVQGFCRGLMAEKLHMVLIEFQQSAHQYNSWKGDQSGVLNIIND